MAEGPKGMTAGHVRTQKSIKLISARCVNKGLSLARESIKLHRHPQQQDVHKGRKLSPRFDSTGMGHEYKDKYIGTRTRTTAGKSHQSRKFNWLGDTFRKHAPNQLGDVKGICFKRNF